MLDLGCGTGNLSLLFALAGCEVAGVDFSPAMLDIARQRVAGGRFLVLDLLGSWEVIAGQQFDVIASAYVFHEFDLENKVATVARLVEQHLNPGGRMVVADISFATRSEMDAARAELEEIWDDDEFYWSAEEAVATMSRRGLSVAYLPVPPFAGVYVIAPNSA